MSHKPTRRTTPVEHHQYRLVVCGHKAVEIAGVCLLLMVQGDLAGVTLTHLAIATKTGLLSITPILGVTFTRFAHRLTDRWFSAAVVAVSTFAADALMHGSHYPGAYTEAALTALSAAMLSLAVSYTPLGKRIDGLAEAFGSDPREEAVTQLEASGADWR